jgi:phage gp29-like protein
MTAHISDVFNKDAIPRLLKVNGMKADRCPKMRVEELQSQDLSVLGDFITKMAQAGALQVDSGLDEFVRNLVGLPPKVEDEEGAMPMGQEMPPNAKEPKSVPQPEETEGDNERTLD